TFDGIKNVRDIHPNFVKDFYEMVEESNSLKNDGLLLPRRRVIQDDSRTFSIQSKLVHDRNDLAYSNFFMINIDEVDRASDAAAEVQHKNFKLSEREKEVADQVVRGLHNSEIADNLFICEVTVKKHLQNIFQKTGVDNRAALVHTLLTT
ncbi:MAG: helix-turn-helix transcriptional regulator, partial [Planctomycetota bacterium]